MDTYPRFNAEHAYKDFQTLRQAGISPVRAWMKACQDHRLAKQNDEYEKFIWLTGMHPDRFLKRGDKILYL